MSRSVDADLVDVANVAALVVDLTGYRVRWLDDDSRLVGIAGWHVVVWPGRVLDRAVLEHEWRRVVDAAGLRTPALIFRDDRDEWRALWPSALQLWESRPAFWTSFRWTVEASLEVWAAVVAELVPEWSDAAERYGCSEQELQGWPQ